MIMVILIVIFYDYRNNMSGSVFILRATVVVKLSTKHVIVRFV